MKKLIIAVVSVFLMIAAAQAFAEDAKSDAKPVVKSYYVCGCGSGCNCNSISDKAGQCGCKKDMVKMSLLAIDGGKAYLCTCGNDCGCKLSDDKTMCGCKKPVKVVDLKGKYVCGCGPDCKCGTISDSPGKCGCGKELKKVE